MSSISGVRESAGSLLSSISSSGEDNNSVTAAALSALDGSANVVVGPRSIPPSVDLTEEEQLVALDSLTINASLIFFPPPIMSSPLSERSPLSRLAPTYISHSPETGGEAADK